MPVYGTIASRFNDDGTTALYQEILGKLAELGLAIDATHLPRVETRKSTARTVIVPSDRVRYLAEIATTVRDYHAYSRQQVAIARERQQLIEARRMLGESKPGNATDDLDALVDEREQALDDSSRKMLEQWPRIRQGYSGDEYVVQVRDREIRTDLRYDTLSGSSIPKVSLPAFEDHGELLKWLLLENLPGSFPFTAGVFAFKRENEDPTRMFAGEGDAFRTNRRFKKLSEHSEAKRLSTAFDSVTLYGCDPDERPDIYGKVGNSGVSIATLEDMKALYDGFDLCSPSTSVSMTINGPAPIILAMYLNTAMDQQLAKFAHQNQRQPTEQEIDRISAWALENIRGTVQADILKEDQGQNTCIFSTEFALKHRPPHSQFLLGVDLGLSHRRGRRQPDLAARVHALQRLYFRRGLPRSRHAHRRFRAQPVVLLLQRHGSGIHGHGARRAPHLGHCNERQVRRQRAQPEAQVPYPDLGPLQRYSYHAAGPDRNL
jgi:methylmalonyl-CoA mutase